MAGTRTPTKPHALRLAFWNADGLREKRDELEEFLLRHEVDVALVSETHLRPSDEPRIRNFQLYRKDRADGRGGGTAVYMKRSLDHSEEDLPATENIEATCVTVNTASVGPLRLIAVYNRPQRALLTRDLDLVLERNVPTVMAGDFNAKHAAWNSRVTNSKGNTLVRYALLNNLSVIGPEEPTHFHRIGHRPDVLDIAVLRNVRLDTMIRAVNELSSDHNPVILELGELTDDGSADQLLHSISWPTYIHHLETNIGPLPVINSTERLELAVSHITAKINAAVGAATRTRVQAATDPLSLPTELKALIRSKNRARSRWQRTRDPADRVHMNQLAGDVRTAIRDLKNQRWKNLLEDAETDTNIMWRLSKSLRTKRAPIPVLHGTRGLVYTCEDKAEAMAESLERQCSPNYEGIDIDHVSHVHRQVRRRLRTEVQENIEFTTPDEIGKILAALKARKAPGPDGIKNTMLKMLPRKAVVAITNIANAALRLCHFPTEWRTADVTMIPKPGKDHKFPQNYRPISLLSSLGKVVEAVVLRRLESHTERLAILPDEQHGFRKHLSTTHQLLRVTEYIAEGMDQRQSTGAIFLDVAKAFDKVWHQGLLFKMMEFGYPHHLTKITASYLHRRKLQVKLMGTRSAPRDITAGVPQGSLLSPLLFNIYASDMPKTLGVMLAQYADDTALMYRSRNHGIINTRLQEAADTMDGWFQKWRIRINPEKSAAVLFTRRRRRPEGHITMSGAPIPWTDSVKYLGVTFDKQLRWTAHIADRVNTAMKTTNRLWPLLHRRSAMSTTNKLRLFTGIVRPQMLYASQVWGGTDVSKIQRLQRKQNRVLRIAVGAPWFVRNTQIHRDTKIPLIKDVIRRGAEKFYAELPHHPMQSLRRVADYDETEIRRVKRPKLAIRI